MTLRVEWLEEIRLRLHVVDLIPHGQTCNGAHVRLPGGVSLDFFLSFLGLDLGFLEWLSDVVGFILIHMC